MSNNIDVRKLGIFIVIAVGLLVSFYAGNLIADNNIADALFIVIGIIITYFTVTSQKWLQYCFIAISFGFIMSPFGFKIGALELCGFFIGCFIIKHAWLKGSLGIPRSLKFGSPIFYATSLFVLYLIFHTIYNISYPHNGELVKLSNILKTLTQISSPFIVIAFALISFNKTKAPDDLYRFVSIVLILGMLLNIIIQIYQVLFLNFTLFSEDDLLLDKYSEKKSLYIPILNITNNIFQLRSIAPISSALAIIILLSKDPTVKFKGTIFYAKILFILSFISALLSGGRATIILCFLFTLIILFKKQRFSSALFITFALFILLISVKVVNDVDSRLVPQSVQRALAPLSFLGFEKASSSIESSSNWRDELRQLSFNDWLQSTRTILFGRSIYAYTETDAAIAREGYFGEMNISLRRGSTHNIVTDLLVPFGLVGLSLYALCVFIIFRKLIYIREIYSKKSSIAGDISSLLIMLVPLYIIYGIFGGAGFTFELGCLMAFLLVIVGRIGKSDFNDTTMKQIRI
jgi:hypothetical protein